LFTHSKKRGTIPGVKIPWVVRPRILGKHLLGIGGEGARKSREFLEPFGGTPRGVLMSMPPNCFVGMFFKALSLKKELVQRKKTGWRPLKGKKRSPSSVNVGIGDPSPRRN